MKALNILGGAAGVTWNNSNQRQQSKSCNEANSAKSKFPQHVAAFGKPNVMINPQGIMFDKFANLALSKFTPAELVELAEQYTVKGS